MNILAFNSGHDGGAALISEGRLQYSLEAEKDDGHRHTYLTASLFARSLEGIEVPDVVAVSGWIKRWFAAAPHPSLINIEAGYLAEGRDGIHTADIVFAGKKVKRFSSSHVRSHIMAAFGMSPFPQGSRCYALIWEGIVGAFYHIDESMNVKKVGDALWSPGTKYLLLYALADPSVPIQDSRVRFENAGKLMALAAYADHSKSPTDADRQLIDSILAVDMSAAAKSQSHKALFAKSSVFNIGVESQAFKDIACHFSEALFDTFCKFADAHLERHLPLVIAGGCGLNCEWNSKWQSSGLFSDVFVPPCANDSGIAIGTAVDAQHHFTGNAKIEWNVYAGDSFIEDVQQDEEGEFARGPLSLVTVCQWLLKGEVIAWVQGRYEMGPRALGNRSMLASPFSALMREKLNGIKQREQFRPIAPICLEEDFHEHFEGANLSPHMLYFQRVKSKVLQAVTHVDGSARAQSVNDSQNHEICQLLREFRRVSGVGVLCNTSLNFKGHGFVNRLSQLLALARDRGIFGLVVGNSFWIHKTHYNGGGFSREPSGL